MTCVVTISRYYNAHCHYCNGRGRCYRGYCNNIVLLQTSDNATQGCCCNTRPMLLQYANKLSQRNTSRGYMDQPYPNEIWVVAICSMDIATARKRRNRRTRYATMYMPSLYASTISQWNMSGDYMRTGYCNTIWVVVICSMDIAMKNISLSYAYYLMQRKIQNRNWCHIYIYH